MKRLMKRICIKFWGSTSEYPVYKAQLAAGYYLSIAIATNTK